MAKGHVLQIRQAWYTPSLNLLWPCANTNTSWCNVHCEGTDFEEVSLYTDLASFFFSFIWKNMGVRESTPLHWWSINSPRFIFYHAHSKDLRICGAMKK